MPVSDYREQVFARIREALRQPAPHHHLHGEGGDGSFLATDLPASDAFRAWLPAVGANLEDQIALFAQNSVQLKTEFVDTHSLEDASRALVTIARDNNWKRIATHRAPLPSDLAEKLALPCLFTDPGYAIADLESCDAAITGCDALVAQTGSIMVSTASAGGRALSVLPPHHVAIARRDQVVPDLTAAYQLMRRLHASNWPSFLSFITGPSRTGDIERILVLGAHGPKKLTVILVP